MPPTLTPLTAEQQALAEENIPLAMWVLRHRWKRGRRPTDDEQAEAMLVLARSALHWRPDDAANFKTYLTTALVHEFHRRWRKENRRPVEARIGGSDWDEFTAAPEPVAPGPVEPLAEAHELLPFLDRLDEKQQLVIRLTYFSGLSDRRIGRLLGTTKQRVWSIRHRAIEKLRWMMGGEE